MCSDGTPALTCRYLSSSNIDDIVATDSARAEEEQSPVPRNIVVPFPVASSAGASAPPTETRATPLSCGILYTLFCGAFLRALPSLLLACFLLLPTMANISFRAFSCRPFVEDDMSQSMIYHIDVDLSVRCSHGSYISEEQESIKRAAWVLLAIWPFGYVLVFVLPCLSRVTLKVRSHCTASRWFSFCCF